MTSYLAGFLGFLPQLLLHVGFLVVVGVWSRGRVRTLGLVAGVVAFVGGALSFGYNLLLPTLAERFDVGFGVLASLSGLFLLFSFVSMGLIAAALVIGGRAHTASEYGTSGPTAGYGPSGPSSGSAPGGVVEGPPSGGLR